MRHQPQGAGFGHYLGAILMLILILTLLFPQEMIQLLGSLIGENARQFLNLLF